MTPPATLPTELLIIWSTGLVTGYAIMVLAGNISRAIKTTIDGMNLP